MNSAIERLLALRIADVMSTNVVTVSANESMNSAAEIFLKHSISGAPVIDENSRCAGVLTALDFVKDRTCACAGHTHAMPALKSDLRRGESVASHMTPNVYVIPGNATLMDAARMMCEHHIHRLMILDREKRPIGVVTSLDLVAAMVNAIEE